MLPPEEWQIQPTRRERQLDGQRAHAPLCGNDLATFQRVACVTAPAWPLTASNNQLPLSVHLSITLVRPRSGA